MTETGWLIELVNGRGPEWLCDDHESPRQFTWTRDASEAIRFSRESDALSVIACCHIGHGIQVNGDPAKVIATEHMWGGGDD